MSNSLQFRQSTDTDHFDLKKCFPVIHALRPHLSLNTFVQQVEQQFSQGYELNALENNGLYCAVIGFRFSHCLAWGSICYIDDLATLASQQKQGYASHLLDKIIERAKTQKCQAVHLDSGHQRFSAHRLYLNKGFNIRSHHFSLEL